MEVKWFKKKKKLQAKMTSIFSLLYKQATFLILGASHSWPQPSLTSYCPYHLFAAASD